MIARPIARSERLLVEAVADELVIYDLDTHLAHALKPVAAAVFAYSDGVNSTAQIAELSVLRLGRPVSESDVADAVAQLHALSLLDLPELDLDRNGLSGFDHDGLSRRDALKTFAAAGIVAGIGSSLLVTSASAAGPGQTVSGDAFACPGPSGGNNTNYLSPSAGIAWTQPTNWTSDDAPGTDEGVPIVPGGSCAYLNTNPGAPGTCFIGKPPASAAECAYFDGTWDSTSNVCSGYQAAVAASNGTCSYGIFWGKSVIGYWQCVPCDGQQGYQCCTVVCAPPDSGYAWGTFAESGSYGPNVLTLPSGWYPYVGCGYTGGPSDSYTACQGGLNEGDPDYTDQGYKGKYCTPNACGQHGGTGCVS